MRHAQLGDKGEELVLIATEPLGECRLGPLGWQGLGTDEEELLLILLGSSGAGTGGLAACGVPPSSSAGRGAVARS